MTRALLLERMRMHRYAVESSVAADGAPQSAVVGVAVSDDFEIVFDTLEQTRKACNLVRDARVAFTMGSMQSDASWGVQIEGIADQPRDDDRERLVHLYLSVFPDGVERQAWPGLTYFRVRPTWIRSSDYQQTPPEIVEFSADALRRL